MLVMEGGGEEGEGRGGEERDKREREWETEREREGRQLPEGEKEVLSACSMQEASSTVVHAQPISPA